MYPHANPSRIPCIYCIKNLARIRAKEALYYRVE